MKAKLVGNCIRTHVDSEVKRREDQRLPAMTDTERFDLEAKVFIDLAWDEFKRITTVRFPSGRCTVASFKSFRQEFGQWGTAVHRSAYFEWTGATLGTKVFDLFVNMLEGLQKGDRGAEIDVNAQRQPEVKTDAVRCGV